EERRRIDRPGTCRVEDDGVRVCTRGERAVRKTESPSGLDGETANQVLYGQLAGFHQLQQACQRGLEAGDAERCLVVGAVLVDRAVGGMVRGDRVDDSLRERGDERLAVLFGA